MLEPPQYKINIDPHTSSSFDFISAQAGALPDVCNPLQDCHMFFAQLDKTAKEKKLK